MKTAGYGTCNDLLPACCLQRTDNDIPRVGKCRSVELKCDEKHYTYRCVTYKTNKEPQMLVEEPEEAPAPEDWIDWTPVDTEDTMSPAAEGESPAQP